MLTVHSEKDDGSSGQHASENRGGLEAVHHGHGDIEQDDIRLKTPGFFDGFHTVGGFITNVKVRALAKKHLEGRSDGAFVVSNEYLFDGRFHPRKLAEASVAGNTLFTVLKSRTPKQGVRHPANRPQRRPRRWL